MECLSSAARNGSLSVLSILIGLVVIPGCGRARIGEHTFREFMEDGVLVAASTGGPLFEGELFRYEEVVTLQQEADRPESLLHGRTGFAWDEPGFLMDEDGRFFVGDRGSARIAVFDQAGQFERSIGRQGQGPGEWGDSFEVYGVTDQRRARDLRSGTSPNYLLPNGRDPP